MLVNEIFRSIQGEGIQAGLPTVFLRTAGCSLRCTWCDTTYAFYDGREMDVKQVVAEASAFGIRRACVTGGEPLDQRETLDLLAALLADGWEVVLETSGGRPIDEVDALEHRHRLHVSLDVKCPSSSMTHRNIWSNLALLRPQDQLKLVVGDEEDYAYAREVLSTHARDVPCPVILQPVYDSAALRWLAERILEDGLDVRVGVQLHKAIWGEVPGR